METDANASADANASTDASTSTRADASASEPAAPPRPGAREVLARWWRLRCPVCGRGKVFHGWIAMHEDCSECQYHFGRDPGYFLGSIYVNYGVTSVVLLAVYFGLEAALHPPLWWLSAVWLPFALTFPLWFHRYGRLGFMLFDLYFAPPEPRDFGRGPETKGPLTTARR